MTCQEVEELAAAYALGALSAGERARIDAHLAACDQHAVSISQLRSTTVLLQATHPDVEPPPGLKARIMTAVLNDPVAPPAPVPGTKERSWPWQGLRLRVQPAVAALVLAVVALLAWNLYLQFGRDGGGSGVEAFVRYMGDGGDVHAYVYYVQEVGVVTVDGLEPLPPGETYQVWARPNGRLLSLGLLKVNDEGQGFVLLSHHVSEDAPVFITVEPYGGADWPTGARVLSTDP